MLKEVEEIYQAKRGKYKEVDGRLDNVLFMEAVQEAMMMDSINTMSREKGV